MERGAICGKTFEWYIYCKHLNIGGIYYLLRTCTSRGLQVNLRCKRSPTPPSNSSCHLKPLHSNQISTRWGEMQYVVKPLNGIFIVNTSKLGELIRFSNIYYCPITLWRYSKAPFLTEGLKDKYNKSFLKSHLS